MSHTCTTRPIRSIRRSLMAVGIVFGALVAGSGAAGAATTAPYTDPSAVGSIGLCNQAGQQITSGSTTSVPFVATAVSTTPANAPYNGPSRTAVLIAYQPQSELPPGEWSGAQLTSSSRYSNPSAPMAAATTRDGSLADFMADFAPRWDGFLQLRMYLGAADQPAFSSNYPTLDIQVVGDTWHAVGGAQVNCQAGTVVSSESLITIATPTTGSPATSGGTGGQSTAGGAATGTGTGPASGSTGTVPGSTPGATTSGGSAPSPTPVTATQSGSSLSSVLTVVLIVLLVAVAAWFLLRRRRPGAASAADATDPGASGSAPPDHDPEDPAPADRGPGQTVGSSSSSSMSEK